MNFIQYFRDISTNLPEIGHTTYESHFSRISNILQMEEFLSQIRSSKGLQLLVVDSISGRLGDNLSDNMFSTQYYTVYILGSVSPGNFDDKEILFSDLQTLFRKIFSKMSYDKRNSLNDLHYLDRNSFTFSSVGPLASNWHGFSFSFNVLDPFLYSYNPDDWNG